MLLGVFMESGEGQQSHFGGGCGVVGDSWELRAEAALPRVGLPALEHTMRGPSLTGGAGEG